MRMARHDDRGAWQCSVELAKALVPFRRTASYPAATRYAARTSCAVASLGILAGGVGGGVNHHMIWTIYSSGNMQAATGGKVAWLVCHKISGERRGRGRRRYNRQAEMNSMV